MTRTSYGKTLSRRLRDLYEEAKQRDTNRAEYLYPDVSATLDLLDEGSSLAAISAYQDIAHKLRSI